MPSIDFESMNKAGKGTTAQQTAVSASAQRKGQLEKISKDDFRSKSFILEFVLVSYCCCDKST